jgi:hypothetical protein
MDAFQEEKNRRKIKLALFFCSSERWQAEGNKKVGMVCAG